MFVYKSSKYHEKPTQKTTSYFDTWSTWFSENVSEWLTQKNPTNLGQISGVKSPNGTGKLPVNYLWLSVIQRSEGIWLTNFFGFDLQ